MRARCQLLEAKPYESGCRKVGGEKRRRYGNFKGSEISLFSEEIYYSPYFARGVSLVSEDAVRELSLAQHLKSSPIIEKIESISSNLERLSQT